MSKGKKRFSYIECVQTLFGVINPLICGTLNRGFIQYLHTEFQIELTLASHWKKKSLYFSLVLQKETHYISDKFIPRSAIHRRHIHVCTRALIRQTRLALFFQRIPHPLIQPRAHARAIHCIRRSSTLVSLPLIRIPAYLMNLHRRERIGLFMHPHAASRAKGICEVYRKGVWSRTIETVRLVSQLRFRSLSTMRRLYDPTSANSTFIAGIPNKAIAALISLEAY